MTNLAVSSIELCPVHFGDLALFNRKIGNLDEVLLYAKICFHQQNSKINHAGKQCIARTRQAMSAWFGWSLRKVDALLASLEEKGFISRAIGLWKGVKSFFISAINHIDYLPINLTRLNTLTQHTGSVLPSIIFSRIAFGMNNTQIEYEALKWCTIKKGVLADLVGISIRTLDKILNSLQEKGLILKKNFIHRGKRQMHYHIPRCVIQTVLESMNKTGDATSKKEQNKNDTSNQQKGNLTKANTHNTSSYPHQNCRLEPAKSIASIKKDQTKQKTNNTTTQAIPEERQLALEKRETTSGIIFNLSAQRQPIDQQEAYNTPYQIGKDKKSHVTLSPRQQAYIAGVLHNIIHREGIQVSSPLELEAQLCYAIANKIANKSLSFKHAVNRNAKIICDGRWTTPFGFYKYTAFGQTIVDNRNQCIKHNHPPQTSTDTLPSFDEKFEDLLKLDLSLTHKGRIKGTSATNPYSYAVILSFLWVYSIVVRKPNTFLSRLFSLSSTFLTYSGVTVEKPVPL